MDSNLENLVSETMKDPAVVGCLFANRQGLAIEAKGIANPQSAGIIVALSEQAAKLEPNSNPPTVILEYDDINCFIHKYGLTGAVFKQKETNK